MIYEKIQDLLVLESRARELYEHLLEYPESTKYRNKLSKIINDEIEHSNEVRRILDLIHLDVGY